MSTSDIVLIIEESTSSIAGLAILISVLWWLFIRKD